jgi:hypothetical protein
VGSSLLRKMDLGPTPSSSTTNHTMLGSRPETEQFSVAGTMTPRTANGRLHDQDSSFAFSVTGIVIRLALTIAGNADFR